jgi:hypothetical protein
MKYLLLPSFVLLFTITQAQNGPGGISTTNGTGNLVLWLKANSLSLPNGANVSSWSDQSGYNNNAVSNVGNEPIFQAATYNNQPTINFTALNTDYLVVADAASLKPNNISIFCVGKYTTGTTSYSPFVIKTNTYSWTEGYGLALNSGANATYTFVNNWSANFVSVPLAINSPTIFSTVYDNVNVQLFHNEVSQGIDPYAANIINSNNNLYLGISPNGVGTGVQAPLNGDIAEVILFNRNVNAAERIIINNYLSSKYNLPLGANDIYDEDNVANGNFDFDVAGIGRVNATSIHNDAKGNIVRINTASDLGDNEFLVWGHNNVALLPTLTSDVPAAVQARVGRTWRVSETGDVGNVTVQFDLNGLTVSNPADLRLIIDIDNDGLFANETAFAGAVGIGGGLYEFQNVAALGNNMRFTIGTVNVVTLPIKITDFTLTNINNETVKINWSFLSDNSVEGFEIYHSNDASKWDFIGKQLNDNASLHISYSITNPSPFNGLSFYKLKIIYKDGHVEYSDIRSVKLNKNALVKLYPNPAANFVTVETDFLARENITLYNSKGQNITNTISIKKINTNSVQLNIEALPAGIYFVKSASQSVSFQKK